ncbi:hypothetical protein [Alteromonas aestuariivivens]|uniref:hypothetical protein n=1 Tax=Alteromonas aestuariivivens TaxID=1938339 RepID=UPI0015F275C8|nr:hypothetical protein [Alteromonas aestuariivivens]
MAKQNYSFLRREPERWFGKKIKKALSHYKYFLEDNLKIITKSQANFSPIHTKIVKTTETLNWALNLTKTRFAV